MKRRKKIDEIARRREANESAAHAKAHCKHDPSNINFELCEHQTKPPKTQPPHAPFFHPDPDPTTHPQPGGLAQTGLSPKPHTPLRVWEAKLNSFLSCDLLPRKNCCCWC